MRKEVFPLAKDLKHLVKLETQGKFNKFFNEAESLEKKYTKLGRHLQLADVLILKIRALWKIGRTKESLKVINQCENELTFLDHPEEVKKRKAHLARHKGVIYGLEHDLKRSMEYYRQSLALAEEIDDKEGIFATRFNIISIYLIMGDLHLALNSAQQNKILSEEIRDVNLIPLSLISLGYVYLRNGDLDQAKDILQRALVLTKEYDSKFFMAFAATNLGLLNWELGDLEQALDYLKQSNNIYEEIDAQHGFASIDNLFYLISLTIEMDSLEQANKFLKQLQHINEQEESAYIRPFYHIAKALILKTSSRIRDKAKAQDILLKLVEEEFLDIEIKIIVMLALCELLLDELKFFENESVFEEALEIARQVYSLAQKSQSSSLTIKLLLLQAKFYIVEGNFEASINFINQAKILAREKGMELLATRADAEKQQLETQYDKWKKLIESNALFGARIEQSRLEEYLREVRRFMKISKL
jgi:tetratricopeptide (TPR) repeat protein